MKHSYDFILPISSPTYPAMVRVVQSQMAKGTSRHLAIVWARRVFPEPVEPNIMILDFSKRMSCVLASRISLP